MAASASERANVERRDNDRVDARVGDDLRVVRGAFAPGSQARDIGGTIRSDIACNPKTRAGNLGQSRGPLLANQPATYDCE